MALMSTPSPAWSWPGESWLTVASWSWLTLEGYRRSLEQVYLVTTRSHQKSQAHMPSHVMVDEPLKSTTVLVLCKISYCRISGRERRL